MFKRVLKKQDSALHGFQKGPGFVHPRGRNCKILRSVIVSYAVDVVDMFVGLKRATDNAFHHGPVFPLIGESSRLVQDPDLHVSVAICSAATSPIRVLRSDDLRRVVSLRPHNDTGLCKQPSYCCVRAIQGFRDGIRRLSGLIHLNNGAYRPVTLVPLPQRLSLWPPWGSASLQVVMNGCIRRAHQLSDFVDAFSGQVQSASHVYGYLRLSRHANTITHINEIMA
jgi:hypothetical protein